MKRFLAKVGLFFVLLATFFAIGTLCPPNEKSFSYAVVKKLQLLNSAESPRIIFIAGSNCGFGIDSEMIAAGTKKNVVNMALHAGAGLYFMLDESLSKIRAGDTVVFAFEYSLFFNEAAGSPEEVTREFFMSPIPFYKFRPEVLRTVIAGTPEYSFERIHVVFTDVRHAIKYSFVKRKNRKKKSSEPKVYSADSFNEFGDVVAHLNLPSKEKIRRSTFGDELDYNAVAALKEAVVSLRERGVRVLIFPPVFQKTSFDHNAKKIELLARIFAENEIPFAVDPARYAFADDLFFDTFYHCNAAGRRERSAKLIEDLATYKNN